VKQTRAVTGKDIQPGDEIKTDAGWLKVGSVTPLSETRIGLFTSSGMIGVNPGAVLTVRRDTPLQSLQQKLSAAKEQQQQAERDVAEAQRKLQTATDLVASYERAIEAAGEGQA
jgi:hypothetical protein